MRAPAILALVTELTAAAVTHPFERRFFEFPVIQFGNFSQTDTSSISVALESLPDGVLEHRILRPATYTFGVAELSLEGSDTDRTIWVMYDGVHGYLQACSPLGLCDGAAAVPASGSKLFQKSKPRPRLGP
jgi:hypothetical protein